MNQEKVKRNLFIKKSCSTPILGRSSNHHNHSFQKRNTNMFKKQFFPNHAPILTTINENSNENEERFDVQERIGKGSFATVFKVQEKSTRKIYALKQVEIGKSSSKAMIDKEIDLLQSLRHEHIVQYHGCIISDESVGLLLDFCEMGSLVDIIEAMNRTFDELECCFILSHTVSALSYLHQNNVIHRDLKCANILLTTEGIIKITDFGVSARLSKDIVYRNSIVGSPYWMSPEVILGSDHSFPADVWSLGISIIEIIEGVPPLADIHPMKALLKIPFDDPPSLSLPEFFSDELLDFVKCCLQKDAKSRSTVQQLQYHPFILKYSNALDQFMFISRIQDDLIEEELLLLQKHGDARYFPMDEIQQETLETVVSFETIRQQRRMSNNDSNQVMNQIEREERNTLLYSDGDNKKLESLGVDDSSISYEHDGDSMIVYDDVSSPSLSSAFGVLTVEDQEICSNERQSTSHENQEMHLKMNSGSSSIVSRRPSLTNKLRTFRENLALGLERLSSQELSFLFSSIVEKSSEFLPSSVQNFLVGNASSLLLNHSLSYEENMNTKILNGEEEKNDQLSDDESIIQIQSPWRFIERMGILILKGANFNT